jgi:hydroxyacylglutathione hydrolase
MISIELLPVLDDNVIYAVAVDATDGANDDDSAFVVDPATADAVLSWLQQPGPRGRPRQLEAVLCTHHHADHTGANLALREATGCRIIGPAHDLERIAGATEGAVVGATVDVCGLALRVLDVRAHTRGHVAFAMDDLVDVVIRHGHRGLRAVEPSLAGRPALFVGDSLFGAGCGRLFEGTGKDLHAALSTLAAQAPDSLVCCAHEYTRSNLVFAAAVRPDVAAIAERISAFDDDCGPSRQSIPSTLGLELATNPFLLALKLPDPVQRVFDLRRQKDTFRP